MDMASQHQESVTLCCEVLNLLNNCNPQGKTSMLIMDTLMGWMMSSHSSILILPMVTSAGRTLASVTQMARIVECGIEAHFQQGINFSAFWPLWFRSRMTYLLFKRIAGLFRVSLFIYFGGTWNFGTCWRGTFGTFVTSRPHFSHNDWMEFRIWNGVMEAANHLSVCK